MTDRLLDIQHLRSWIGREEWAVDTVSAELVRRFRATFDLPDADQVSGDVAPLLINYCLAQPTVSTSLLGEDGHPPKGDFLPAVPLPRRMWASSDLTFFGDIHVGDQLRRVSRIADVTVKDGRTGTLCFVTVEHRVDRAGEPLIEETQNIVYREAATSLSQSSSAVAEAPANGADVRAVSVPAPLLFRYSALTFNGHRIHYDRSYAVEVERYPGLVVHGPLQATWLLNYAKDLDGRAPRRFSFRGLSPLFEHDRISLHATKEAGKMKLWTAREGGGVGMVAEASWS